MTENLFSYGTLRDPRVQRAHFGRLVPTAPDALPGFRVDVLTITDPAVIAVSGSDQHPILRRSGDPADVVSGVVLEVSAQELAAADAYEVADYVRVEVRLRSGRRAWVYVEPTG